jgi:hypothetical protein
VGVLEILKEEWAKVGERPKGLIECEIERCADEKREWEMAHNRGMILGTLKK